MERQHMLIASTDLRVGGVTTALLSLLEALERDGRYAVDLLLYELGGPLQARLPASVRLLPPGRVSGARNALRKLTSPAYLFGRARAFYWDKFEKRPLVAMQIRARGGARFSRKLTRAYDVALAFLEFWPMQYVAFAVEARVKLCWVHVDYAGGLIDPRWDEAAIRRCDRLVLVSERCVENFQRLCPALADKAVYLPNLLSQRAVRAQAAQAPARILPRDGRLRLVTAARIDLRHKALDRGVRAFAELKRRGLSGRLCWYIVGGGPDEGALRRLIAELDLGDSVFLLGEQLRPLPIVAQGDLFFLPSRVEGKPMAVTEAQMLGLPALVARYASAAEQVRDGVDGWIVENSQAGVTEGLCALAARPEVVARMREAVAAHDYGNEGDAARLYALLDALRGERGRA